MSEEMTRKEVIWQLKGLLLGELRTTTKERKALEYAISSLETDEAYQLEYEQPEFCKADNSVLEDINKMLAEINGEIACAEYHEVECNHKTEKQEGRRVIAKIVHKYCDKYTESER